MRNGNGKPGNVTLCELPPAGVVVVSATGYSEGTEPGTVHRHSTAMTVSTITIGATVKPASNGEDAVGRVYAWNRLRGTVVDLWNDCGEVRVQVRWHQRAPYPTVVPAYFLAAA